MHWLISLCNSPLIFYSAVSGALSRALLAQETPKRLDNVTTRITGSVRELCRAAAAPAIAGLKAVDGLIITGATGTNVNDVAVALIGEG